MAMTSANETTFAYFNRNGGTTTSAHRQSVSHKVIISRNEYVGLTCNVSRHRSKRTCIYSYH